MGRRKNKHRKISGFGILQGEQIEKKEDKKEEKTVIMTTPDFNKMELSDLSFTKNNEKDEVEVEAEHITLVIPMNVYYQMMTYVKLLDDEINGLGLIEKIGGATYRVSEIFLLKQTVSKSACDIDPAAMAQLMEKLINEGKNPSMLRFWWHSHNTMGTFWSGTDERTGKQFAGTEYLFSLVANHKEEMRAKMNIFQPVELSIDNITILIETPSAQESLIEDCKKEIEECVSTEETVFVPYHQRTQCDFQFGHNNFHRAEEVERKDTDLVVRDEVEDDNFGPWGDTFIDGDVRLVWCVHQRLYEGFDVKTNHKLTDSEMLSRTSIDYNKDYNNPLGTAVIETAEGSYGPYGREGHPYYGLDY